MALPVQRQHSTSRNPLVNKYLSISYFRIKRKIRTSSNKILDKENTGKIVCSLSITRKNSFFSFQLLLNWPSKNYIQIILMSKFVGKTITSLNTSKSYSAFSSSRILPQMQSVSSHVLL